MSCWYCVNRSSARARGRVDRAGAHPGRSHLSWLRLVSGAKREQPKTRVTLASTDSRRLRIATTDARPALSPACPREPGDAAAEDQPAAGVIEESLAGGHRAEPCGRRAVVVAHDGDVGEGRGGAPRIGLFPAVGKAPRLQEEDVGLGTCVGPGQNLGQLGEARAAADALRMDEHDERRPVCLVCQPAIGRPLHERVGARPGLILVGPQQPEPRCRAAEPHGRDDHPEPGAWLRRRRVSGRSLRAVVGEHWTSLCNTGSP